MPNGYQVVANGVPESEDTQGNWTTHVWQAHDPMASYLATFDVGEWTIRTRVTSNGLPVIDAIDPDVLPRVRASVRREPEILSFLESKFGPYPFESAGGIFPDDPPARVRAGDADATDLRAVLLPVRRLGHRARAGAPVVRRPASPCIAGRTSGSTRASPPTPSGCGAEHEGFGTPRQTSKAIWRAIPARSPFWDVVIGDPGVANLFDGAVYTRGAMTLQALRDEVGDDAFWTILHTWTQTYGFDTGSTDAFIALAEQVSGQDLGDLFDAWLFTPNRPPASAVTGSGVVSAPPVATEHAISWLRSFERRSAP